VEFGRRVVRIYPACVEGAQGQAMRALKVLLQRGRSPVATPLKLDVEVFTVQ